MGNPLGGAAGGASASPKKKNPVGGNAAKAAAARRAAAPKPPPVRTTSSGQYSRPSAPSGGGQGPIAPIKPPAPGINQYLGGDVTYQQQLRSLGKTLADFLAQGKMQRSKISEDYGSATKSLNTQKVQDLGNIEQDFAGRGLLTSGLYAGAVGDYNTDFLQKMGELSKNQKRSLADLLTQETNFKGEQNLQKQSAREAAIRRRAEKYGL